jgi:hypothetical protein
MEMGRASRALDLLGRDRDMVALDQDLITTDVIAVHEDQVIRRRTARHLAGEELTDRGPRSNLDVVGKPVGLVVDVDDADGLDWHETSSVFTFKSKNMLQVRKQAIQNAKEVVATEGP